VVEVREEGDEGEEGEVGAWLLGCGDGGDVVLETLLDPAAVVPVTLPETLTGRPVELVD
jgi:DUF917 family protein